ncbi:tryptophan 2,3-dioxygenase [Anaeromyxobacter sp. PSR-1]|uniref:tryptophan 2,3-dioxygenase n=1 Tax=Anaeromyxobacter sp. PSR-1 TaxID=1300915 RepID=UPI0005E0727E|nr:tryptophan 2,3-dioxygenase family protein [Anaeromyxobacter sp. PSR-1]GAO02698.1 tryptophan 2,3-dioxygenase [Anaeromyxobacter sp. PSR-1]
MTDPSAHSAALTYGSYLALDELLAAQRPRSEEHDELLFIVVHQVYELWFKQLLHELTWLQERLHRGEGGHALATLKRVLTILKTVVAQVDVIETMTPRQFTAFRSRLEAASGFQSAQFRVLEATLGRRDERMLAPYPPDGPGHARIAAAMAAPSLFDSLLRYLATQGFATPAAPEPRPAGWRQPSEAVQRVLLDVYRADGEPALVCERFVDLDEGVQEWRYRHVKMVERTIGDKPGTGGSAGAQYLRSTLFTPAFPDLWAVRGAL